MIEWRDIATAPVNRPVLVAGNGPTRFGFVDEMGQWRGMHKHPMHHPPKVWMEIPRWKHDSTVIESG